MEYYQSKLDLAATLQAMPARLNSKLLNQNESLIKFSAQMRRRKASDCERKIIQGQTGISCQLPKRSSSCFPTASILLNPMALKGKKRRVCLFFPLSTALLQLIKLTYWLNKTTQNVLAPNMGGVIMRTVSMTRLPPLFTRTNHLWRRPGGCLCHYTFRLYS